MKSAIITHKDCPDGAASVIIATKIQASVQAHFADHSQVDALTTKLANELEPGGRLMLADISCSRKTLFDVMDILNQKGASLEIYEHHVSQDWLQSLRPSTGLNFLCIFDLNRCGSKIFYESYVKDFPVLEAYGDFINAINDRDLWINQDPKGEFLTKLHQIYDDELFVKRFLQNVTMVPTSDERVIMNYQDRKEEKRLQQLLDSIEIKTDSKNFKYGIIYGSGSGSELLNRAIHQNNLEYALLVDFNTRRASIRGLGVMNCANYAMSKGGGGHRCAAGFPLNLDLPKL